MLEPILAGDPELTALRAQLDGGAWAADTCFPPLRHRWTPDLAARYDLFRRRHAGVD